MPEEPVIALNNVLKKRGGFTLEIDELIVNEGEVVGLIGNNGAGKSTLIRIFLSLIFPDQGTVTLYKDNQPVSEPADWKQDVGFVFDDLFFYNEGTLDKLAQFMKRAYHSWDQERFDRLAEQMELEHFKPVKNYSRGMRMKASLAAALAHEPAVLILDEPTAGLDTKTRKQMLAAIKKEHETRNTTVIISSHILSDMENLVTNVVMLDNGSIPVAGPVSGLLEEKGVHDLDQLYERYLGGGDDEASV